MITFSAAQFTPTPIQEQGRGVWRLAAALDVAVLGLPWLTIPAGFGSDGTSVPWWAMGLFDEWGPDSLPGVLHDYLLTTPTPRWVSDLLFFAALRSQGVPELHAALMYLAVRSRPAPKAPSQAADTPLTAP